MPNQPTQPGVPNEWALEEAYAALFKAHGLTITPAQMTRLAAAEVSPKDLAEHLDWYQELKSEPQDPYAFIIRKLSQKYGLS